MKSRLVSQMLTSLKLFATVHFATFSPVHRIRDFAATETGAKFEHCNNGLAKRRKVHEGFAMSKTKSDSHADNEDNMISVTNPNFYGIAAIYLGHPCPGVRMAAIKLLAVLPKHYFGQNTESEQSSVCSKHSVELDKLQLLIAENVHDAHPHVRLSALNALLEIHSQGFDLNVRLFPFAATAAKTDEINSDCRLEAIRLMTVLSHLHPHYPIAFIQGVAVTLADEVITVCCKSRQMLRSIFPGVYQSVQGLLGYSCPCSFGCSALVGKFGKCYPRKNATGS